VPFVTPTLHRFGPACTAPPQFFQFACSVLDHMVKTRTSKVHNPLI